MVGQVLLRHVDHRLVDFHLGDVLHAGMAAYLAQNAAVAAADDQHAARGAMGEDRHVGQHLVVDELIPLGGLHDAIEHHHPAEHRVVEDHQVLVLGFGLEVDLVDQEVLTVGVIQRFAPGSSHRSAPRLAGVP